MALDSVPSRGYFVHLFLDRGVSMSGSRRFSINPSPEYSSSFSWAVQYTESLCSEQGVLGGGHNEITRAFSKQENKPRLY
jgi:hypothetical protein